ncbi:MAG TPA: type II toxin-antitoxin system VapC family toxin [Candidatus Acidoferrum sp.]|nr:type II toxin-antitoxin system VapC family toxin [Candidatus Acidoferrum sp.]
MFLLDTTVWIDLIRTNSPSIRQKLSQHTSAVIGLSIITLCELQFGLERHAQSHPHLHVRRQSLLAAILAPFQIYALDQSVVQIYGRIRAALQSSGAGIGPLDTFIAAQALSLGATLITSNTKEFSRVPGLPIDNWR